MFSLTQRLAQSQSAQSSNKINEAICAYQNSLIAPIERAYNNGAISRDAYTAQYQQAAQSVREYTRTLESR